MSWLMIISILLIGAITAHYAKKRGRRPTVWFAIGTLFGLLGLLLLFLMPSYAEKETPEASNLQPLSPAPVQAPFSQDHLQKEWYYMDENHQQQGPIAFGALKQAWEHKQLIPDTFVWCEGMPDWRQIKDVPNFSDALAT